MNKYYYASGALKKRNVLLCCTGTPPRKDYVNLWDIVSGEPKERYGCYDNNACVPFNILTYNAQCKVKRGRLFYTFA